MPEQPTRSDNQIAEAIDLVKAYAKQETLEPIQGAGRFIKFGLPGALLLALGVVLTALGTIRYLQAEGPQWADASGSSSWVPYLGGLLVCVLAIGLAVAVGMRRSSLQRKETQR